MMYWQFIFVGFVIIFTAVIGWTFIRKYNFATHYQAFGWVLFSMALWSLGMIGFIVAKSDEMAKFWMELGHIGGLWIGIWLFYFAYVFPPSRPRARFMLRWLLFFGFIYSVILLVPGYLLEGIRTHDWGRDGLFVDSSRHIFSVGFLFFFTSAIVLFIRRFFQADDKTTRLQIGYILGGIFFGSIPGLIFNIILPDPWMGENFRYVWLGPISGILIAVTISFALYKNYLAHPKVLVGEFFSILLILFLSVRLFFVESKGQLVWQFIILFFTAIFGFLLVRSILEEVNRLEKTRQLKKLLDDANWRLKELEHSKNDFLSIASHQLRTPLSVIKGYISLLSEGDYGKLDKKMRTILDNIAYSIERLMHLVDQFLDLSQIESGKMEFDFAKSDFVELVKHVIHELKPRLSSKLKLEFVNEVKGKVEGEVDADKIINVIFNFVDNAIKYTEAGTITIVLAKDTDKIIVRIKDTGIGLSAEDKEKVFSKFFRSKDVLAAVGRSGTGLGLYIAAKFVAGHKGEIWCDSPGKDLGSEFGFSVPLKQEVKTKQVAA